MGVLYLVVPLDPEGRAYLQDQGEPVAGSVPDGRDPTPAEIRSVVRQLHGINAVEANGKRGELLQVHLETPDSPGGPHTLLNVQAKREDAPVGIAFEKGWPELIILV